MSNFVEKAPVHHCHGPCSLYAFARLQLHNDTQNKEFEASLPHFKAGGRQTEFLDTLSRADILLAASIHDPGAAAFLAQQTGKCRTALFLDCAPQLEALTRLDGLQVDR